VSQLGADRDCVDERAFSLISASGSEFGRVVNKIKEKKRIFVELSLHLVVFIVEFGHRLPDVHHHQL